MTRYRRGFFPGFLVGWMLLALWGSACGQDRGIVTRKFQETVVPSEQRVALVIGNSAYETAPLRNPINDARAMGKVLSELGFHVTVKENLGQKEMKVAIQAFGEQIQKGGVGLFYFAGHGIQAGGRNFLIPVGARIEHEKQVEYEGVDAGSVLAEMEYARNRLNIVILDACRDNPFARSFRSSALGLASVNAPSGTLIAYATSPGSVANDGPGENGIYTGELVKAMQTPGLKIEDVFKQVRSAVKELTQGKQVPWESSSLEGDFFFKAPEKGPEPAEREGGSGGVIPVAKLGGDAPARSVRTWKEPVTGMVFVWVPGGCFLMGSPYSEERRDADEGPVHEVCVDGFWMGKTEVTNGQFRKFQPQHDSGEYQGCALDGESQPVVHVGWDDAAGFAQWLKAQTGGNYNFRLPTEAEWEYACRAGTETAYYWSDDQAQACEYENVGDETPRRQWNWTGGNSCDDGYLATAPVATFQANGFGLHDLAGNVGEWCMDVYTVDVYNKHERSNPVHVLENAGADRVIRGGHWRAGPGEVRCANRGAGLPATMNDHLGFRLVREQ
ncbi:MAG: SUMF1/EgtB/PvdO family nonheme iron enzyme [Deltaproteobacteria bacterium]|nr:SUMF1/EgtB/PvdO family nonheme iron enzyme [Deltaproteobacteria bacterium]